MTHRRRRKRRVEAGYSHSVGSAVGDVVGGYDGDHDRDDSEALVQRDSNAGTAVDGGIRQCGRVWVGRPNGHGGIGVMRGRCKRDAGDIVGDAGIIVGGVRVKHRGDDGIAAQRKGAEAGVDGDDVEHWRHGVEGIFGSVRPVSRIYFWSAMSKRPALGLDVPRVLSMSGLPGVVSAALVPFVFEPVHTQDGLVTSVPCSFVATRLFQLPL